MFSQEKSKWIYQGPWKVILHVISGRGNQAPQAQREQTDRRNIAQVKIFVFVLTHTSFTHRSKNKQYQDVAVKQVFGVSCSKSLVNVEFQQLRPVRAHCPAAVDTGSTNVPISPKKTPYASH